MLQARALACLRVSIFFRCVCVVVSDCGEAASQGWLVCMYGCEEERCEEEENCKEKECKEEEEEEGCEKEVEYKEKYPEEEEGFVCRV